MDSIQFWIIQYVFQSILHTAVAALTVESLLRIWQEERPQVRLRFLLLVLLLPALSFPVFQFLNPDRGNYRFRSDLALFDTNQWLNLRMWDEFLLWHAGLVLLAGIAILFLLQDALALLVPLQRRSEKVPFQPDRHAGLREPVSRFGASFPAVFVLPTKSPLLYTAGWKNSSIHISQALLDHLDPDELEAALAHELAHVKRKDNAIGWLLIILRLLIFFNPVALIEFRRMIHEREKLCDDLAVSITGKPLALAAGLAKVFRIAETERPAASVLRRLELHSYRTHTEERLMRIVHPQTRRLPAYPYFRMTLTSLCLLCLLFFVV